MEFEKFKERFQENFGRISNRATTLFVTGTNMDELWNLYLDSFPPGTNKILHTQREFDCSACKSFISLHKRLMLARNIV